MEDILQKILTANVYDVAIETPLDKAKKLSKRFENSIWFKREDLQPVFSFKLRGAYNRMSRLTKKERDTGVIASSAGNHAQGVALSASYLNCRAVIVMPITTPPVKIASVRSFNAEVILHGDTYDEAYQEAIRLSKEQKLVFIHPFDDAEVIAGQGTIGVEIVRQIESPPFAIYIAVGGGGLIGGIATYIKNLWPQVKIIGVEPEDACAMTQSLKAKKRIQLNEIGLFADGVAVKQVGEITFDLASKYVDRMITVKTDEICAAMKDFYEDTRSILEPAGALAIAGLKLDICKNNIHNENLIAVTCGANMNFERLRFVAERSVIGEEKEAMIAVEIPEKAGSLKFLCKVIGNRNLTEFSYRMSNKDSADIFIGVEVENKNDRLLFIDKIRNSGFKCIDLTDDEFSKMHLRYMVGGRLPETNNISTNSYKELLYRFEFPERPGALMRFLEAMRPNWSISIFHYRNHGADIGRIIVGVLVQKNDFHNWEKFLKDIGYKNWQETTNPAYKLFLGANIENSG
ncbi:MULTISPECIES: threonine ammonia-lyase, biosynthetic [unclassified Prochlorococcus]|uniref:threonine ammonia-lyase, biosynthetic n=1 Tax=unclassified Prochlorococcus TaxID=2627481 RepID=UPI0005339307|nr:MULTISPECIES: threonine ammonia-lyase, biosynthetic [unclassified Prochlorococcus]KGG15247.1 Threonine dehydratase biosynthetic [Prochlorococcus sp. MIT 0602]